MTRVFQKGLRRKQMREIKFRAWDKYSKIMLYSDEEKYPLWELLRDCYKDERILMQYVGLKDKNGKEIYEGDILNTNSPHQVVAPYYVKTALPFIELVNSTGWDYDNGDYYHGGDITSHAWKEFEVIGNIYEQDYLLKENL